MSLDPPADIVASSFGKLDSRSPPDLAHALVGLIGENLGLICGSLARVTQAEAVIYGGSTLVDNPALREILKLVTAVASGGDCDFLPQGAFCGAVGAAVLSER